MRCIFNDLQVKLIKYTNYSVFYDLRDDIHYLNLRTVVNDISLSKFSGQLDPNRRERFFENGSLSYDLSYEM